MRLSEMAFKNSFSKIFDIDEDLPHLYSKIMKINDYLLFSQPFEIEDIKKLLAEAPGVVLQDDPQNNVYPLAREIAGKDEVFVGRIRRDFSVDNGINIWVVADNIRKGAATNTVQIAELLIK